LVSRFDSLREKRHYAEGRVHELVLESAKLIAEGVYVHEPHVESRTIRVELAYEHGKPETWDALEMCKSIDDREISIQ
jgi:hypothetical protein